MMDSLHLLLEGQVQAHLQPLVLLLPEVEVGGVGLPQVLLAGMVVQVAEAGHLLLVVVEPPHRQVKEMLVGLIPQTLVAVEVVQVKLVILMVKAKVEMELLLRFLDHR